MTLKEVWSMLRGHRTDFRFANMSMTYDPGDPAHHWYGKALEYKQMHEMACRREADLEAQLERRTTERDYHMRIADKLSARIRANAPWANHPVGEGMKRTQEIMQGDVDIGRPACGQGDEWGRHPTDARYGGPKSCDS